MMVPNKAAFTKWLVCIALISGFLTAGCDHTLMRNDLEEIQERGELVVITRNNATCYYEGPRGPTGFEFELASEFAESIGVRLRPLIIEDEAEMVAALRNGQADIIAAGFPFGRQSARLLALGPSYLEVTQQVVGRRGGPDIENLSDLKDVNLWTTASSARLEVLKRLKKKNSFLHWKTMPEASAEELLYMVWNQSVPLTVVESNVLNMNRRYFPELVVHFDIGSSQNLTWAMDPNNRHLLHAVNSWFSKKTTQENIHGLIDHYYSHLEDFDYVDLARYRRRIDNLLPKYRPFFEEASIKHGLDWQLVAALAYQESHWNPRAKSFTGVRGIMMLTQDTAKTLGLTNRMAPKESIHAGTRYLARLHHMISKDVPEPDRTLMALAAYNVGFGHLQDARELAERLGKPSDTWHGVRSVLPLLQKKKYYSTLSHGYARGTEAVQYVDHIRTYRTVLNMAIAPPSYNGYGG
jgi:membrane-bound lytic murein transglycosylase F